jgi:hypothetical protein
MVRRLLMVLRTMIRVSVAREAYLRVSRARDARVRVSGARDSKHKGFGHACPRVCCGSMTCHQPLGGGGGGWYGWCCWLWRWGR